MSVEVPCDILFTVTLLSLVLTGLPFFNQVMLTGTAEELKTHSSDRLVPAMRGEPRLSNDTWTATRRQQHEA